MKKTNYTILVNENLTQKIEYPALITIYQYQGSCRNSLQVKLATAAPPPHPHPQKKIGFSILKPPSRSSVEFNNMPLSKLIWAQYG